MRRRVTMLLRCPGIASAATQLWHAQFPTFTCRCGRRIRRIRRFRVELGRRGNSTNVDGDVDAILS
jgi:hypothetical protein